MRTEQDERRLVASLSRWQLEKLAQKRATKSNWQGERLSSLVDLLEIEVAELKDAILDRLAKTDVWKEAADVANLAAMVADRYRKGDGGAE